MFHDRFAVARFKQLVDEFNIKTIVETGTLYAESTTCFAEFVNDVYSVEIDKKPLDVARANLIKGGYALVDEREHIFFYANGKKRITLFWSNSPYVIRQIINYLEEPICFYLDAHWTEYWPIKDEIREIKPRPNSIIIIHDFKVPGKLFGYDVYKGVTLSLPYPEKQNEASVALGYDLVKDDLAYVNPEYRICYNEEAAGPSRGILYALPDKKVV